MEEAVLMAKKKIIGQVRYEMVDVFGKKKTAAYDYLGGGLSKLIGVFGTKKEAQNAIKTLRR